MFICELCKEEKNGRKYVYANSTRTIKILVCKECHTAKVNTIQANAEKVVSSEIVTGILRPSEEH